MAWRLVGLGGALLLCSCLKINEEFSVVHDLTTGSETPEQTSETRVSGSTGQDDSPVPTLDSAGSDTTSSSLTSQGLSDSSSDSTSAAPSALWIPINLRNVSPTHALTSETSVRLEFDHAALVSSEGARIDGSNVQVFVSDGSSEQEIDRVLDPGSRWNDAQTRIWFNLNAEIPAGQTVDQRYYLVVHPSVSSPKADASELFLAFDAFDDATLNASMWAATAQAVGPGEQSAEITDGSLVLRAMASGQGKRAQTVRTAGNWQVDAIAMEASVRTDSNLVVGNNCTQEFLAGFWSPDPSAFVRSLLYHDRVGYRFANHQDSDPFGFMIQETGERLTNSAYHRYSMRWGDPVVEVVVDESSRRNFSIQSSTHTEPSKGPLVAGFEAVAFGECPGVVSRVEVDWVMVRKAARSEPSLSLRMGEATRREL